MTAYIYRPHHPKANANGMIPKDLAHDVREWAVSVISDTMEPLRHMGTGRLIDSKSQFRQDTRASGCIEIGNEAPKPRKPIQLDRGQRRDAIRKSLYDLRNR